MSTAKRKVKIGVIMGGPSVAHEVSLSSGLQVMSALPKDRYDVIPIIVSKTRTYSIGGRPSVPEHEALSLIKALGIKAVFLAMHGEYGEDGTLQELLERSGIPYTGSSSVSSRMAMDKDRTAKILERHGIKVPAYAVLSDLHQAHQLVQKFGYPIVVKPLARVLSVGVSIVEREDELEGAVKKAQEYQSEFIVQKFIKGEEVTCAVLDQGSSDTAFALPPTKVIASSDRFLGYHVKNVVGAPEKIIPAPFRPDLIKQIQATAVRVHQTLHCSHMSRVDMIWDGKRLWVLEIDTIPGLDSEGLLPQAARIAGIEMSDLLNRMMRSVLSRRTSRIFRRNLF